MYFLLFILICLFNTLSLDTACFLLYISFPRNQCKNSFLSVSHFSSCRKRNSNADCNKTRARNRVLHTSETSFCHTNLYCQQWLTRFSYRYVTRLITMSFLDFVLMYISTTIIDTFIWLIGLLHFRSEPAAKTLPLIYIKKTQSQFQIASYLYNFIHSTLY